MAKWENFLLASAPQQLAIIIRSFNLPIIMDALSSLYRLAIELAASADCILSPVWLTAVNSSF